MKAIRYYGKEDIRLEDIPEPELQPGTVKISLAYNGICGSDLHLYFDGVMPPAPSADEPHPISGETLPVVFGHEFSGVVDEVGEGVTKVKAGDRVAVEPFMVCGECPACKKGMYNLCEKMGFIGISGRGGGLAEKIVVEERWVHNVGDIPLDQAALIEPLSVGHHAVAHAGAAFGKAEGKVAVVGGAGPIGLLTASVLKAYGVKTIVSEPSEIRRAKLEEVGVADLIVNPAEEDLLEKVKEFTDGVLADFAFDCAGIAAVADQLLSVLTTGGHLEVVALHVHPFELDLMGAIMMPERSISACIGYCDDHEPAIKLVQEGKVNLEPLITSKITADRIVEDGYQRLRGNPGEVKILVSMK
ncbi:2,3-butanediol dehydrogenase [Actinotignum schaalii]|uniref:2,3-butanediol dehydrogenase n=1 Tax=Actinotignum schaalii TaxID=59505 RepID=UPI00373EF13F